MTFSGWFENAYFFTCFFSIIYIVEATIMCSYRVGVVIDTEKIFIVSIYPAKQKDELRWYKTVLNHLSPTNKWTKIV